MSLSKVFERNTVDLDPKSAESSTAEAAVNHDSRVDLTESKMTTAPAAMAVLSNETPGTSSAEGNDSKESSFSELLSLPDVVKLLFLQKVAANNGLHELLKFRLICKDTKAWIDGAPEQTAKNVLFAGGKVTMNCDLKMVKRFLTTPPPFLVHSLTLYVSNNGFIMGPPSEAVATAFMDPLPEEDIIDPSEVWNMFCDFWKPRLTSLEVIKKNDTVHFGGQNISHEYIATFLRKVLEESPNLDKFSFVGCKNWMIRLRLPIPVCFERISEISIVGSLLGSPIKPEVVEELFSVLLRNPNLKKLAVELNDHHFDISGISKLIEKHRNNKQFHLDLYLNDKSMLNLSKFNGSAGAFYGLLKAIVGCEFETRLNLDFQNVGTNGRLQQIKSELGDWNFWRFLNLVERFGSNVVPDSSLVELHTLDKLKYLRLSGIDPEEEGLLIRFPPKLQQLEFGPGFPAVENLPVDLKELKLNEITGTLDELQSLLISLSLHCVKLEKLNFTWNYKAGPENAEERNLTEINFPALKSLVLKGFDQEVHIVRDLLLDRLKLDQMPLVHLGISFHCDMSDIGGVDPFAELDFEMAEVVEDIMDNDIMMGLQQMIVVEPHHRQPMVEVEHGGALELDGGEEEIDIANIFPGGSIDNNMIRLMNSDILSKLCDGPIGKTLLFLDIPKETVTLAGLDTFLEFQSIVSDNVKNKIEAEGRGPWLYQYPMQFEY